MAEFSPTHIRAFLAEARELKSEDNTAPDYDRALIDVGRHVFNLSVATMYKELDLPYAKPLRDPEYMEQATLAAIVERIRRILWIDDTGQWNPDNEWAGVDSLEAIADILISNDLAPVEIPDD